MKRVLFVAFRHLATNRHFTLINVIGTSLSLIAFYLLSVYVFNELSFDSSYTDHERIYRVNVAYRMPDSEFHWPATPPVLATHLLTHPGILQTSRFYRADFSHRFSRGNVVYVEPRIFYADSAFLEIFDFPFIAGDRTTALDHPNSIVLTKDVASKYFGDEDALGKQLILNDTRTLTVTGVLADLPKTSHLNFSYLASFSTFEVPRGYTEDLTSWSWSSFITYIKLTPGAEAHQVEADIKNIWKSNNEMAPGRDIDIHLQRAAQIYLHSEIYNHPSVSSIFRVGNLNALIGLTAAAVVVLLNALFNFTNLAVATIVRRAKSISIHKIIGSGDGRMIWHFFTEGAIVQLASGVIALAAVTTFGSFFGELIGYPVLWQESAASLSLATLAIAMIVMTALAIIYPTVVIKSMKVLTVLREGLIAKHRGISARQILIVFQICLTGILLSTTLIVRKQLQYISGKDLGYQSENVVVVRMLGEDMAAHYDQLKNAISRLPEVASVSRGKFAFDGRSGGSSLKQRLQPDTEFKSVAVYESHHDFIRTAGIRLLAGRDFSAEFANDSAEAIILNQAALASIGLKVEDAVGTQVTFDDLNKVVVGVVEDFNYSSLHNAVGPMVIVMPYTNSTSFFLKIEPGNVRARLASVQSAWREVAPGIPFDFVFLDDQLNTLYRNDQRFSRMVDLFTLIGIVTACIGLGAIAWFSMNLRLKEVAIRKALGAETYRIVSLLCSQYARYVLIGLSFSIPVSLYAADSWLSGFAYRITSIVDAIILSILALVIVFILLLVNVSGRLAVMSPLKNLRSE